MGIYQINREYVFMNRSFGLLLKTAVFAVLFSSVALATPPAKDLDAGHGRGGDDRSHPLGKKLRALRERALQDKIMGKTSGKVHEVAKGQYVELAREGEDPVWTVIGEFGDFPHNSIAEPDRNYDNTTFWISDFNRDYYLDLLFSEGEDVNSMRQFYIENSSNRYAVYGDVTDWALAPNDACTYDDDISYPSDPDDPDYDPNYPDGGNAVWYFLRDTVNDWYAKEIAAGKTAAEIDEYLSQFDIWDRYDWDGDGNFDEPDGYIDHMNFLHAGEGNEAGGGALGDCAIWSHSWAAFSSLEGSEGPSPEFLIGGLQIGESAFWLKDYIINPENGGVGVFAHEFGHDLDLPDLYNTGPPPGNSTGFWTLMSSGSWLSQDPDTIGTRPGHMGMWEKFQLGWLNYEVAFAGSKSEHKLGPAEANTKQAQGLFVVLPQKEVVEQIADPYAGEYFYYSGSGNDLDNWMTNSFTLGAVSTLAAKVNVQIEVDWDYAYLVVSTDGGAHWDNVETNLSTNDDPWGQNFGNGITGTSPGWVDLTADLSAYTGDVLLGFRYWTDVSAVEPGFMVDNLEITGHPLDGAETDTGWTFDGFTVTTGTESALYNNYYLAEFRQYRGYDVGLYTGPYNFGFLDDPELRNWVEKFPYQGGLLISYWDTSQSDNNTSTHPGRGLILPIDAHPEALMTPSDTPWRARVQGYDSPFGLQPTDAMTLHRNSEPSYIPSLPAVPVFDDNKQYWNPETPEVGVMNPNTGTQIRVKSNSARGSFMQVEVRPSKLSGRLRK
jgi:immune inhibitor A